MSIFLIILLKRFNTFPTVHEMFYESLLFRGPGRTIRARDRQSVVWHRINAAEA